MRYFLYFPLFALPLIIYNILMLLNEGVVGETVLFTIPMMSSEEGMSINGGDVFVMSGVILLYFELLKAARMSRSTILDHALSLGIFIVFLIEFIIVADAGTATFLTLTLMSLLDVVAGFTITISTARRDIGLSADAFGGD